MDPHPSEVLPRSWGSRVLGWPLLALWGRPLVVLLVPLAAAEPGMWRVAAVLVALVAAEGTATWHLAESGLELRTGPLRWRRIPWRGLLRAVESEVDLGRGWMVPGVTVQFGVDGLRPMERQYEANKSWPERLRPEVRRVVPLHGSAFLTPSDRVKWIRAIDAEVARRSGGT